MRARAARDPVVVPPRVRGLHDDGCRRRRHLGEPRHRVGLEHPVAVAAQQLELVGGARRRGPGRRAPRRRCRPSSAWRGRWPSQPLKSPTTRTARAFGAQTANDVPQRAVDARARARRARSRAPRAGPRATRCRSSSPSDGRMTVGVVGDVVGAVACRSSRARSARASPARVPSQMPAADVLERHPRAVGEDRGDAAWRAGAGRARSTPLRPRASVLGWMPSTECGSW